MLDIELYRNIEMTDWETLNRSFIDKYDHSEVSTIFINLSLVRFFSPFLSHIYETFSGVFIVDSQDRSMGRKPFFIGPNSFWATYNILNPTQSSGILFPLGVEDPRRGMNNNSEFFGTLSPKLHYILVGPFASTHESRVEFTSWTETQTIKLGTKRISPKSYAKLSAEFKYVVCPRGNGIDTHRFWEALYRGSCPIIVNSNWSEYFSELGIPFLAVNKFGDLYSLRRSYLDEVFEQFQAKLKTNSYLLNPSFWWNRVTVDI